MKVVSFVAGVVGLLVVVLAFVGRFHGPATVTVLGTTHHASTLILLGNTVLLCACWLALMGRKEKV